LNLFIFIFLLPKKIVVRPVLSVLAQMNEKLNVIEKTVAKPAVAKNEFIPWTKKIFWLLFHLPILNNLKNLKEI